MNDDESPPTAVPPAGPRLQFSLATLMLLVTVASVYCALTAWLGPVMIFVLMLFVGPVGASIVVRICGSKVEGDITAWSGLVTMVAWASVAVCGGVLGALSFPSGNAGSLIMSSVAAALFFLPYAFLFGISTGIAWEAGSRGLKKCWRWIGRRVHVPSGPKD